MCAAFTVDIRRHVEDLGEADVIKTLHGNPTVEPHCTLYVYTQARRQLYNNTYTSCMLYVQCVWKKMRPHYSKGRGRAGQEGKRQEGRGEREGAEEGCRWEGGSIPPTLQSYFDHWTRQ